MTTYPNAELAPMLPPEALPSELPQRPDALLNALVKEGSLHMLTLDQRRILIAMLEANSDAEACRMVGISSQKLSYWRRTNKVFVEAEQAIADGLLMEARAKLSSMMPAAAEALGDALDAEKSIEVTCPCGCTDSEGEPFTFKVRIPDMKLRVQVAKELFKRTGDFGARLKVDVSGEVKTRDISWEEQMTLAQLRRGDSVPSDIYNSLLHKGLIPPELMSQGQLVEGSARVLSDSSNPDEDGDLS